MIKSAVAELLAKKTGLTKGQALSVIDVFGHVIREATTKTDKSVRVPGLGTFRQARIAERSGVGPSGAPWQKPATVAVRFRAK